MGLTVISLFDGCSGGLQALTEEGFIIDEYYASEIDKPAISVAKYNHEPIITHIGDVTKVRYEAGVLYTENGTFEVPKVDLVIGGSPCQGFSFAGKQLNFEDPRSKLFFEFVRIVRETGCTYFFLENVRMKQEFQDVISEQLSVKPVMLNSALVSAQNRVRLYWTNIKGYVEPKDEGILLKHIIHECGSEYVMVDRDKSHCITASIGRTTHREYFQKNQGQMVYEGQIKYEIPLERSPVKLTERNLRHFRGEGEKSLCCTATMYKGAGNNGTTLVFEELRKYIVPFDKTLQILEKEVEKGKVGYFRKDSQANRVYFIHGKAVTLCGDAGGGAAKMGQYLFGCITPDRVEKRQNGQRFNEGYKFYTLTAQDKHGILIEGYIRKLTPTECERLQTLPDGYTAKGFENGKVVDISDTQRYKMLGNGWTIKAIRSFFKNIPAERWHQ